MRERRREGGYLRKIMNLKVTTKIVAVLLVLILAGVFFYFYYAQKRAMVEKIIKEADELHHAGDNEKAIPLFEEALKVLPEGIERLQVLANLATDLFVTEDDENQKRAVNMVKTEIANANTPALGRAALVIVLGSFYTLAPDDEFRRNIIFEGEPYSSFLEGNDDLNLAQRRLYEYSSSFAPVSIAQLKIAYWYGEQLMINDNLTPQQRQQYANFISQQIRIGLSLLPRDAQWLSLSRVFQVRLLSQSLKGILAINDLGDENKQEVESAYENLISDFELNSGGPNGDVHAYGRSLDARLQYASYLARAYGQSRADKIAQVVQPITKTPPQSLFMIYLKSMTQGQSPTEYPSVSELSLISQASPEFRSFLNELGGQF